MTTPSSPRRHHFSPIEELFRCALVPSGVEPSGIRCDFVAFVSAISGLETKPGVRGKKAKEQFARVFSMAKCIVDCIERRVLLPDRVSVYDLRKAYEELKKSCTHASCSSIENVVNAFFGECYDSIEFNKPGGSVGAAPEHPKEKRAGAAGATPDTAALPKVEGQVETYSKYGLTEEQISEGIRALVKAKGAKARRKMERVLDEELPRRQRPTEQKQRSGVKTLEQAMGVVLAHAREKGVEGHHELIKIIEEETLEKERRTLTLTQAANRIARRLNDPNFDKNKLFRYFERGLIGGHGPDGRKLFSPEECDEFTPPPPRAAGRPRKRTATESAS